MHRIGMLGTLGLALGLTACASLSRSTVSAVKIATPPPAAIVAPARALTLTSTALPTASFDPTEAPPTATLPPVPTATRLPPTATARPRPSPLPPTPTPIPIDRDEQDVIDLINQIRREHGLSTLTVDARLMAAAEGHSLDMAQHDFFSHAGSDGSSVEDRLSRQGYAWIFYAEDLACGYDSSAAVVQGWMDSPAHRENLLAQPARQIGVGFVNNQGGNCRAYWTIDLAAGPERQYPGEGKHDTAN